MLLTPGDKRDRSLPLHRTNFRNLSNFNKNDSKLVTRVPHKRVELQYGER